MKIRNNIGSLNTSPISLESSKSIIGRVLHVVIDENSLGFDNNYSNIGRIYYTDNLGEFAEVDVLKCPSAIPIWSNIKQYPLIEELVFIFTLPKNDSVNNQNSTEGYYFPPLNLFNNDQHNSQTLFNILDDDVILGDTIEENSDSKNLRYFEGDLILSGRWGNAIRFSNTKKNNNNNPWSLSGSPKDPLLIISNNYNSDETIHTEDINKDGSSIYITSHQSIPLKSNRIYSSNIVSTVVNQNYTDNQLLLVSDRITLNSKKDEIILDSKTNVIISSKNTIIDSEEVINLKPNKYLFLGNNEDEIPLQQAVLGNNLVEIISSMIYSLSLLSKNMSNAVSPSEGQKITSITMASNTCYEDMLTISKKLNTLLSNKVYVAN